MPLNNLPSAGHWITLDWQRDARPVGGPPIAFRKDWIVPRDFTDAHIRIGGSYRYALYVNGAIAGYGPARSFPDALSFDTWPLTRLLHAGANQIAVLLLPYTGVTGYAPISRLGLRVDASATLADGSVETLGSDHTWKARAADWYEETPLLISLPVGFQEHFDIAKEPTGWKVAPPGDGWRDAFVIGPVGTPPWRAEEARTIPLMREEPITPSIVWRGRAPREMTAVAMNLARQFNAQVVEGAPFSECGGASIEMADNNVYTFDFGRTRLIRPGLSATSIQGEIRVEAYYSLDMDDRPKANCGFGHAQEGAVDSVVLTGAETADWEALTPRGFRFLTLRLSGSGRSKLTLRAKSVDYDFPRPATFVCNDTTLQEIWNMSATTLRSSANDVYVDTCSRENMLWTFDACVQAKAAFYTFGETALWRRCLNLIGAGIDSGGRPRAIVPAETSFMCLIDQAFMWICSCRDYTVITANDDVARHNADAIGRLLAFATEHITTDGYFVPPSSTWHWIDWAPLEKRPYSLAVNAYLTVAADAAATVAEAAKMPALRAQAEGLANALRPRLAEFFDNDAGCFRARIEPQESEIEHSLMMPRDPNPLSHDLHGNILACIASGGDEAQRASALRFVAGRLREPLGPGNAFGPGWTDTLLAPLFDAGYGQVALDFVKKAYGQTIVAGAPTWGEGFGTSRYNTAHGWGACVNSLIAEQIAGAGPTRDGRDRRTPRPELARELEYRVETGNAHFAVIFRNGRTETSS
ncbi:MAG: hypothetical protein P4L33_03725 [Capsulimonadaceae bacterium]|nr:hypothetical protein [Capsulimonadaceae bacterium]